MANHAFFINPKSHTVANKGSVLARIKPANNFQVFTLDDFSLLSEHMISCGKAGIKTLFIEGGDGTIQGVLSSLLHHQSEFAGLPSIVVLAGGMTNAIALQLGIKRATPAKIQKFMGDGGTHILVPLLQARYHENDQKHYGFLFSTGAIARATKYTVDHVHSAGIKGSAAVRTTLRRALFGDAKTKALILDPSPLRLNVDGAEITGGHILTITTTLPKALLGFNVFWGRGTGAVKVSHACEGAKRKIRNVAKFVRKTQTKQSSQRLAEDGFQSWAVDDFTITHDGPLVMDGEFLPQTSSAITISASAPLRFLK